MFKLSAVAFTLSFFLNASHAECAFNKFDIIENFESSDDNLDYMNLNLIPAKIDIKIPSEFKDIGTNMGISILFRKPNSDSSGILLYEKTGDYQPKEDGSIYDFYEKLFSGESENYCKYAEIAKLNEMNYRIKVIKNGGHIYAYGNYIENNFFILNEDNHDIAFNSLFRHINKEQVEHILKSINFRK